MSALPRCPECGRRAIVSVLALREPRCLLHAWLGTAWTKHGATTWALDGQRSGSAGTGARRRDAPAGGSAPHN